MPTLHDPVAVDLFGVTVRWYALFILTGIVVGVAVASRIARRRGMDHDFLLDVTPWVIFAAILGARAYYLLLDWRVYRADPSKILTLRLAGLTIHGALIAGVITFAVLCRRRHQPFLDWADVVIAIVPIGQAIGRWGNWANQEAFGTPTTLPWAVTINPNNRPAEYAQYSTFHPTFLYEGLLDLLIASVLITMALRAQSSRWLRPGDVLWSYCVLYGVARLVVERVRTDSLYIGPLPAAYWMSFAFIAFGASMLVYRHRNVYVPDSTPSIHAAAE